MAYLQMLLAFVTLNIIYYIGQFIFSIKSGICNNHYFLGFNPRLGEIKICGIKFSIGLFIPLFPFSRIYKIENGKKERVNMPWEFNTFPVWKRVVVTFGGVISLMTAGVFILIVSAYTNVEEYISKEEVNRFGIYPSKEAIKAGFKRGDKILMINGKDYESFNDLAPLESKSYRILRSGKTMIVNINEELINDFLMNHEAFFSVDPPFEVQGVLSGSEADKAGLKSGDKITGFNYLMINSFYDLRDSLSKYKERDVILTIERYEGKAKEYFTITVRPDLNGKIGFMPKLLINYSKKENTLVESVLLRFKNFYLTGYSNILGFYKIVSGEVYYGKTGPIRIAETIGNSWNRMWQITGYMTAWIALLNLLPYPRSCFWEIIPLAYEGVTKKTFLYKNFKILNWISYILFFGISLLSVISDLTKIF